MTSYAGLHFQEGARLSQQLREKGVLLPLLSSERAEDHHVLHVAVMHRSAPAPLASFCLNSLALRTYLQRKITSVLHSLCACLVSRVVCHVLFTTDQNSTDSVQTFVGVLIANYFQ